MSNQTIFEFSDKVSLVDTDVMLLQEDSNGTAYKVTVANLRTSLLDTNITVGGTIGSDTITIQSNNDVIDAGRYSADANGPFTFLRKSRNATKGSHTIVQDSDSLGGLLWLGSDGTNWVRAAAIGVTVSGTPGTNDMPGQMYFATTPDGSSSEVTRMIIAQSGDITFTGNEVQLAPTSGDGKILCRATSGNDCYISLTETGVSDRWSVGCLGGDSTLFFKTGSSVTSSAEMRLSSDGKLIVGVPVSAANRALHVAADTDQLLRLENKSASTTSDYINVEFLGYDSSTNTINSQIRAYYTGATSSDIRFLVRDTGVSEAGRFTEAGRFIVGTDPGGSELISTSGDIFASGYIASAEYSLLGNTATETTTGTNTTYSLGNVSTIVYNGSSSATWRSINSGSTGRILWIHNASSSTLTLNHEDGLATAANRIRCPNSSSIVLGQYDSCLLKYGGANYARWMAIPAT